MQSRVVQQVDNICAINSFSAETEVATSEGEKPISLIQIGDQVLAYNTVTDSTGYYMVDGLISHEDPAVIELTLDDETLTTTLEHPFYTLEAGWNALNYHIVIFFEKNNLTVNITGRGDYREDGLFVHLPIDRPS